MVIGILGGTFNPIHSEHLLVAEEVRRKMNLSKVIFVPSKIPPLKNISIHPQHRYNMVKIAISGNSFFEISDIELKTNSISYTYNTIVELKKELAKQLVFIIGSDNIASLPSWFRWKDLIKECEWAIVSRPEYSFENLEKLKLEIPHKDYQKLKKNLIEIPQTYLSSTLIRKKCAQKHTIKDLVPSAVEKYIKMNNIYHAKN